MRPVPARGHSALCLKLGVVLLAGAGTAAGMLSVRQERINAAYELTESVGRRADVDRAMLIENALTQIMRCFLIG